jgi:hypothetical protein
MIGSQSDDAIQRIKGLLRKLVRIVLEKYRKFSIFGR